LIVVDASVVLHALAADDAGGRIARERLERGQGLAAPQLLDIEVVSALRAHLRLGRISSSRAEAALVDLGVLDVDRWDHGGLVGRAWSLRDALSAYDATYVALAEHLRCPLVTTDARLAKGAAHAKSPANVEVLTAG
jgi:predicted nucleic acid-binding protein